MHTVARIGLIVLALLAHAACLIQPIQPPEVPSEAATASDQDPVSQYVVLQGDNLRGIAGQLDTTPQALIAANQLEPRRLLNRGQHLLVPQTAPVDETMTTLKHLADSTVFHIVYRGESPYSIAKQYGISVQELAAANQLQGPMLFKAQRLIIPTVSEENMPQLADATPSEPQASPSIDSPIQENTEQTSAPDTSTIIVTETITVTKVISEDIAAVSTGDITVSEEISSMAPVTTTGIITSAVVTSGTVPAALDEVALVELTALEAWAEPEGGFEVFSPKENGAYRSPIEVIGLANTQGGIVNLRLLDSNGQVLAWRVQMDEPQEAFNFFHTSLRFSVEEPTDAVLRISETSIDDGTQLRQVEVPVVLMPGQRAIDVHLPSVGSVVCGEIQVSGYSDTSEARVVIELRKPDGEVVDMVDTIGGHHGDYRDFFALLNLQTDEPQALLVSASATDPDGENGQLDETVVPITLYPTATEGCP